MTRDHGGNRCAFGVFNSEPFVYNRPQRKFLKEAIADSPSQTLWNLAAQTSRFEPYNQLFQPFKPTSSHNSAGSKEAESTKPASTAPPCGKLAKIKEPSREPRDETLSHFETFFDSTQGSKGGNGADVKVYVKNERVLHCHSAFVRYSRVPIRRRLRNKRHGSPLHVLFQLKGMGV